MASAASTGLYLFKHKAKGFPCKIVRRFTSAEVNAPGSGMRIRGFVLRVCECGKTQQGFLVMGKYSETKGCDARCEGATGPACECSCRGMNHGGSFAEKLPRPVDRLFGAGPEERGQSPSAKREGQTDGEASKRPARDSRTGYG